MSSQEVTSDAFEIQRSDVKIQGIYDYGRFGEVFKGLLKGKTEVIIKTFRPGDHKIESFLREAEVLKKLQHENIIKLHGMVSKHPVYLVMEYLEHGNLGQYLIAKKMCSIKAKVKAAIQIATGMEYIISMNYVHQDLRAEAMYVGANEVIKIGRFNTAYPTVDGFHQRVITRVPVKWTAPEVMAYMVSSEKSEVWSFGILLMEIFTNGAPPYPDIANKDVMDKVRAGHRMSKPPGCPDEMYELMEKSWLLYDMMRPTFQEIKETLVEYSKDI